MIKKCFKILLAFIIILSNFIILIDKNDLKALDKNLSFESKKQNYLQADKSLASIPKTIEVEIKFDSLDNQRKIIMGNYKYGENCFSLEVSADNRLRYVEFVYENGNLVSSIDYKLNSIKVFDGNWHDMSIVRNVVNNEINFYLDGFLEETLALSGEKNEVLKDDVKLDEIHYIGTDSRKTYFLDADISEVRLWDISKDADEISESVDQELNGNEKGLISNWQFDYYALSTTNNIIINKVSQQPILTAINFDLLKERTFLEFNSSNQNYVEITDNLEKAPKTIEFWAKFNKNPNKRQLIFSNYIYGSNGMGVEITADNQLRYVEFAYENNNLVGSLDIRTIDQDICNDKWTHYAIVRDFENNQVVIYKNGNELISQKISNEGTDRLTEDLSFTNKHYIGTDFRNGNKYYLDGQIDKFTLWNDSKTADEIHNIMNLEIVGNELDLLHSWDFDYDNLSNINPIIKDKVESGIDALAVNFEFSNEPQYSNEGTDFSKGDIEIEMKNTVSEIPLTFETWLKMPKSAANDRGGVIVGNLFDSYYRDIPIVNFEIYTNGVPRLYWTVNEKTYDYKATGINVCNDKWVHVAITYDQDNKIMTTYINGQKAHSASIDMQLEKLNQPMKIGKDSRDAYNFKGELADLRIWSTTRSQEEIANNFDKEIIDETGLLGSWKLDKASNNQYLDSSANQNHAQSYWISEDLFSKSEDGYNSIAVIPDTQTLAMSAPSGFTKLTKWIKNNQQELGIGAVIHVGDIVNERSSHAEWKNAKNAMNELNGVVPYVFSGGNHDVEIKKIDGVWYGLRSTPLMNQYFPYSEVSNQPTFGGAYKEGEVDNTYSYFTINNVDFMFISLEQSPRLEVLQWANQITEENKDKKVIVTTHEYLFFDGNPTTRESQDHLDFVGGSTTGEEMWNEYIKKHENITAVIAGHVGYPDLVTSKRIGENGNEVTQILCDAQFMDRDDVNNGSGEGLGMVMILSFKENSNEIKVNWYSTVKEQFYREKNQYTDTMELTAEVYKDDLQTLYNECLKLKETDYTELTWTNFKIALDNAKIILDKADASQAEVDNALKSLSDAKAALVKVEDVNTDKTALKIAIDKANEITDEDLANVVPVVVEEFKAALQEANEVYANTSATQEEVNNAFDRLASAMQKLEFFKGDKTALEAFVNKVNTLEKDKYTKSSWDGFEVALSNANKVLADENALETEVNEAYDSLVRAFLDLRLIPNKDLLNDLISKAKSLEAANYSVDSFKAMQEALNNAKAVAANENATQVEVDNAKDVLAKAIANLQCVNNTVTTPATDSKVTSVSNGDTISVKTGDESLVSLLAGLSLLSLAGISLLRRKEN